ncbi:hypothetical protein HPB48_000661 [Haemaphysalis longicornis]|uniref:Uncharacterized protein n=1 Tax=Haemaphysalis longicornis TaxID=44386 RepID=A0A9J6FY03_HAELO|nr:hypothetical protein HPB48_000661 [Haemaphysalis longicornis]
MDQGIIETTEELYRKALLRRMLTAYDASKGYNIDLLGALHLLNILWKELAPSKVANCFAHAGISRTLVSDPDNDQLNGDWTCGDLHEAVHKIAGQEAENDFETFALAESRRWLNRAGIETFALAAAPVVAQTSDVEIIDTCWWPRRERRAGGRIAT